MVYLMPELELVTDEVYEQYRALTRKFTRLIIAGIKENRERYQHLRNPNTRGKKQNIPVSGYKARVDIIARPPHHFILGRESRLRVGRLETAIIVQGPLVDWTDYSRGIYTYSGRGGEIRVVTGDFLRCLRGYLDKIGNDLREGSLEIFGYLERGNYFTFVDRVLKCVNDSLAQVKGRPRLPGLR